jgi:hypothetical protein
MPSASHPPYRWPPADQLRQVTFEANIAPYASGSVLVSFGLTRVICAATIEPKVPTWMRQQGVPGGWLTAEYSMLPYSTLERKPRDISKGKIDGRTVEIQRLIGRSLRAVVDLEETRRQHALDRLRRAPGRRRHAHRLDHRRLPRRASRRAKTARREKNRRESHRRFRRRRERGAARGPRAARPRLRRGPGRRGGLQRRDDRPRPIRRSPGQRARNPPLPTSSSKACSCSRRRA